MLHWMHALHHWLRRVEFVEPLLLFSRQEILRVMSRFLFYGADACTLLVRKVKLLGQCKEVRRVLRAVFYGTHCFASRALGRFGRTRFPEVSRLALLRPEPDSAAYGYGSC